MNATAQARCTGNSESSQALHLGWHWQAASRQLSREPRITDRGITGHPFPVAGAWGLGPCRQCQDNTGREADLGHVLRPYTGGLEMTETESRRYQYQKKLWLEGWCLIFRGKALARKCASTAGS